MRLKQVKSKKHISFDIQLTPSFKYSFVGVFTYCVVESSEGVKA